MTIIDGVPFLASPNHTAGRQGSAITDIVIHWMDGTLANTDQEFLNGGRKVSAHYGIENGVIHQYVALADTAWHAGDWAENCRSIGIEHSAAPGRDATPATIATSVAVIVALARKYGIDPSHIYPHNKFFGTQCPGTLPLAAMVAQVRAQLGKPVPPSPTPPAPSGKPAYPGYPTSLSSYGDYVTRMIQTRLKALNYPVVVDGVFGNDTAKWTGLFQSRHACAADGVVGPATWAALFA